MPQPSSRPDSDRNLLFGILALQMNFISRDDLVAGMNSWVLEKQKPLGQVLLEQGRLTAEQVQVLDALIVQHLKVHGGDVERSLQAVGAASTVPSLLTPIPDDDLQASLSTILAEPEKKTTTYHPSPDGVRYRLLRPHAGGGLGDVYVAEDTELHREVALKEIKPQFADDAASRGRFMLEAEITGGLEHPGIVPVYGLGVYPDGRPYYAMRFIRGDNLRAAIERFHGADKPGRDAGERSLALRQLLRRFIDVCNAVAYAHSRGVLHRDLKPANIMLGKFGETLVVDWGLAKPGMESGRSAGEPSGEPALQPSSGSGLHETQAGTAIGTIPFMSPEQASGRLDLLGHASDIYSLGSTLYVLLTGERPYRGKDDADTLTRVQRGQFPPPREVKPRTPPALDAICRKAMAFEIKDRYATALEFAGDLEHWLADEPAAAYPEPWTARVARWSRRRRTTLVGLGVFLVSAVIALSITTALVWTEQRRTAKQKEIAEQNYVLAQEQVFTSAELLEYAEVDLASVPALHAKRKGILKSASRACRQVLEQQPDEPAIQKRAAQVYRYLANVHRLSDETEEAGPLYQDSLRLYETLAEQYSRGTDYWTKLAETLRDSASLHAKVGRLPEASDALERAIKIVNGRLSKDPNLPGHLHTLATSLLDLSAVKSSLGVEADSRKITQQALTLFQQLAAMPPATVHAYNSLLLAAAHNRLAVSEREAGRLKDARTAHNIAIKLLKEMSDNKAIRVAPADILNSLAWCRLEQSRTLSQVPDKRTDAETNFGAAALQWDGLARSYPWIPLYRDRQAIALQLRGQLRLEEKRFNDARADLGASQVSLEKLVQEYPQVVGYRGDLGKTYTSLGRLAQSEGNTAKASEWFGMALEALEKAAKQSRHDIQLQHSLKAVQTEMR